jgi:DNA-binding response OmpR family regulator
MFRLKKINPAKAWIDKNKKKILIVEDDALLSNAMSHTVAYAGFDNLIVDNGLKVLTATKNYKPNMILLDLIIPGLDGFEILRQLKADTQTKNIPVCVVSNLSNIADVKSVKVMGADEYFIKANTDLENIVKYIKKKLG